MSEYSQALIDKLKKGYVNDPGVILTADEELILRRWEEAWNFLLESKNHKASVKMLKRRFPEMSERTLYRDVNAALEFFGNVIVRSKDATRTLLSELLLDYASRRKDVDPAGELKALIEFGKINHLHKEDPEDMSKIYGERKQSVIQLDEKSSGFLLSMIGMGTFDLSKISRGVLLEQENDNVQPATAAAGGSSSAS